MAAVTAPRCGKERCWQGGGGKRHEPPRRTPTVTAPRPPPQPQEGARRHRDSPMVLAAAAVEAAAVAAADVRPPQPWRRGANERPPPSLHSGAAAAAGAATSAALQILQSPLRCVRSVTAGQPNCASAHVLRKDRIGRGGEAGGIAPTPRPQPLPASPELSRELARLSLPAPLLKSSRLPLLAFLRRFRHFYPWHLPLLSLCMKENSCGFLRRILLFFYPITHTHNKRAAAKRRRIADETEGGGKWLPELKMAA